MSQHYFLTFYKAEEVLITMGWDKPLRGYFMTIDRAFAEDDEPLWSNLNAAIPHPPSLIPFLVVLEDMGIKIPQKMIQEIREDGAANIGNKVVWHSIRDGVYDRAQNSSN